MIIEDAFRHQDFVQVQLTLIFSFSPQENGLRECDVEQIWDNISSSRFSSLGFVCIMRNGQNKSRIPGHVYFTTDQSAVVTGEVKDHGV